MGWQRAGAGGERAVRWQDVSPRLEGLELPQPVFRVFSSGGALADFERSAMPGTPPRGGGFDFHDRELVLVSPGPRSSTGYDVRVLSVVERRRSLLVRVRELTPSLGEPVQARVTYPFRLLAIPRTDKPVHIAWQGQ